MYHFIREKWGKIQRLVQLTKARRSRDKLGTSSRRDLRVWSLPGQVELATYWKILPNGTGCALLVYAHHRQMMKYDFFIENRSHFHVFPAIGTRLDFPMNNVLEQMEWTFDQLPPHFKAAITQHPRAELRGSTLSIPRAIQEEVVAELRKLWREAPWEKVH
jgi:hypothetical protein